MTERKPTLDDRWSKVISAVNPAQNEMDRTLLEELRARSERAFEGTADAENVSRADRLPRIWRKTIWVGLSVAATMMVCLTGWLVATRPSGSSIARSSRHESPVDTMPREIGTRTDMPTSRWRLRRAWGESEEMMWELLDEHRLALDSPSSETTTVWNSRNTLFLEHEMEMTQ